MLGGCPLPAGTRDLRAGRASIALHACPPLLLCFAVSLPCSRVSPAGVPAATLSPAPPASCAAPVLAPFLRARSQGTGDHATNRGCPEQSREPQPGHGALGPLLLHLTSSPGAMPAACPTLPVVPLSPHACSLCPCRGTRARSQHPGPGAGRTPSPRGRPRAFVAQRARAASAWPPAQAGSVPPRRHSRVTWPRPRRPPCLQAARREQRPALPCLGQPLGPARLCFPCLQRCGAACVSRALQPPALLRPCPAKLQPLLSLLPPRSAPAPCPALPAA